MNDLRVYLVAKPNDSSKDRDHLHVAITLVVVVAAAILE